MPFGWKTEYVKKIANDYPGEWEFFAIAKQACIQLEWEYMMVDEHTFTATTPTGWTLNEEIITITFDNETIVFNSQSESIELYEGGRNKRNVEEILLPAIEKVKRKWTEDDILAAAAELKQETLAQIKSGNRVFVEKMTYGLKGHEITFSIIAICLFVYLFIAAKKGHWMALSIDEIIANGGNLRTFTTGGQWWRLVSNIFIHVSAWHLLVNMLAFYFIGMFAESLLGRGKFLIAFISTGILASLAGLVWDAEGITAGTSGAIFGIYGVSLAFSTTSYISKKFSKTLLTSIALYAAFTITMALNTDFNIAINLVGLLSGVIVGYLFYFFHFRKNRARAGGTRISVEILLITGLLVYFYLNTGKDDSLRFQSTVMKLNQIELKAIMQLQRMQYSETNEDAARVLRDSTLPEWRYFQKQISKTKEYHLNSEFDNKRKLLLEYANMRVKQTELIYKSLHEGTDKYDAQIEKISEKIESIIDEMGY
jgi:rhomboid protease GluP